jgi:pyruvate formate lyase activating enzyme
MKKEAMFYKKFKDGNVQCFLCAHKCFIEDGNYGFCGVRRNIEGTVYSEVYGKVIAKSIDPIEKKPLYHFLPGTSSYSIATVGCNFKCGFCQNWQISQASMKENNMPGEYIEPKRIVEEAKLRGCKSIAYTYTEPTIFFEYAYDISKLAKENSLYNIFVTNGYMTKDALIKIKPYLDACNVDLKFFNEESYKNICKASLKPVLESIENMKKLGIWIEITTLIIPGVNDSEKELKNIANFIKSVGKETPWHISKFHPDYNFIDNKSTPIKTLKEAERIAKDVGLKYIYLGNVPQETNTFCPKCKKILIKREGYDILSNMRENGKCPNCNTIIEGIWK